MFADKLVYNLPASILGLSLNILLNILLIPIYGAIGAAIATAVASILTATVLLFFANKAHPLPIKAKRLVSLFTIVVVFTLLAYPVLYLEWGFAWKIFVKVLLLLLFIIISVNLKYITTTVIKSVFFSIIRFNYK